ncbi:hypothetical protein [Halospeciosus flavus]|uniref:Uncharacterized protein n=1 Tax=Halospeciosus flavus TaxID=3032283 RepID=A0ABD5Z3Z4_9EURY|nr:hypothetical protein [Halospeciosus flavus]
MAIGPPGVRREHPGEAVGESRGADDRPPPAVPVAAGPTRLPVLREDEHPVVGHGVLRVVERVACSRPVEDGHVDARVGEEGVGRASGGERVAGEEETFVGAP